MNTLHCKNLMHVHLFLALHFLIGLLVLSTLQFYKENLLDIFAGVNMFR